MNLSVIHAAAEIRAGYLQAIEFTECGPDDPEENQNGEFSQELLDLAMLDCRELIDAFPQFIDPDACPDREQLGIDLWLTRNGHGTGYWDREDLNGEELSNQLTKYAESIGERCLYAGDDGELYI